MNEFSASIAKGLSAAQEAEKNTFEIDRVLIRMRSAIEEATDNRVKLVRYLTPLGDPTSNVIRALANIGNSNDAIKRVTALYLEATAPGGDKFEIARLDIPPSGYPCVVIRGANRETCFDEGSLVASLKELLESPEVGKIIAKLIQSPQT